MDRREFLRLAGGLGVMAFAGLAGWRCSRMPGGRIEMPALPYAPNALEPHISARTVEIHYGRHHRAYLENTRRLAAGARFGRSTLEEIVAAGVSGEADRALFDQAAQAYNHAFYWDSMAPEGGGEPEEGPLRQALEAGFGSFQGFRQAFREAAAAHFGSGWVWLTAGDDGLSVETTANADTPLARGGRPLLCLDLWEHAYYLDYQDRRADYVQAWLDHLVEWRFAAWHLAAESGTAA